VRIQHSVRTRQRPNARLLAFASALTLATALARSAAAADAQPTAPAVGEAAAAELGEVTVTAQRRTENAQTIPVAVHVVSGAQLQQSTQIASVNDIATLIPNVQAGDSGSNQPRWFVRGLGTNRIEFATVNPIGIYFDDVYIANTFAQEAPLYDLERVEAAIGPQGTLWGKNANAGAINFISRKPTFTPDGYIRVGYGSFNHHQVQGAYGGPISDSLAFRAAFYDDGGDSYQNLLSTGRSIGSTQTIGGRALLDYRPNDKLDVLLNFHGYRRDGVQNGWNVEPDPKLPVSSQIYKTFYPGGYLVTPFGTVNYVQATPYRTTSIGGNAKVTAELGRLTLTSITGGESLEVWNGAGGQVPYPANSPVVGQVFAASTTTPIQVDNHEYELSQELRIANPGTDRWTWQAGIFGYFERLDQSSLSFAPANLLNPSGSQVLGTTKANTYTEWSNTAVAQDKWSYAAFASTSYDFTERFKVQAGVRWSEEDITYKTSYSALGNTAANNQLILSAGVLNNPGAPQLYSASAHHAFPSWVYDIKPQYQITPNILTYLSYAHAVEAGGFTTETDTALSPAAYGVAGAAFSYSAPSLLLPEKLDAYEAGLKSQWFDKRVTFNLTLFDYQIQDAVTNVTTPVVNLSVPSGVANGVVFRNAGKAYSRGGEIEVDAIPLENWRLGFTVGYAKTRYTSQNSPTYNLLDTQFPRSPKWNLQATTSYDLALPPGLGSVQLAADLNWRSDFWLYPNTCYQFGVGCAPGSSGPDYSFREKGYAVANLHLTWFPHDDRRLAFQLEVLNATNTHYFSHVLAGSTTGTITRLYAQPISAFGSVTYHF
jgi:iron complex outermembrane receptor protein